MNKKIEKIIIKKMEEAYNERFRVNKVFTLGKMSGRYLVELTCDNSLAEKVIVSFSKKLFSNVIQDMTDSYIQCVRRLEITNIVERYIQSIMCEEYKVFFSPGSNQITGKYDLATPIDVILAEFDSYDEFFILSKENLSVEVIEKIKQVFEKKGFTVSVQISSLIDEAVYSGITESYCDNNQLEEIGKQFHSLYFDEGKYTVENYEDLEKRMKMPITIN